MEINFSMKKVIAALCLILVAVLSFGKVAGWASDFSTQEHTITQTDEKISSVQALAAGSVAMSATLSLLPGDVCTPIAGELAELTKYFLLILSVLFLEKYMITIAGLLAFRVLIPIACLIMVVWLFTSKAELLKLAAKLAIFALALFLAIPASIGISDLIYKTKAAQVQQAAEESTEISENADENESWLEGLRGAISDAAKYAGKYLNSLTESLAILLVTSCIIPLLVAAFFVWLVRTLFNSDILKWDGFHFKHFK